MNSGTIYLITNIINGKMYIGQTVNYLSNGKKWGVINRWKKHVKNSENENPECRLIGSAIKKYGKDNFSIQELIICNIEHLNYYEYDFINLYNTLSPNGYNLISGGKNGRFHSEETKKLMSLTRTGKKHSEETKIKIGLSHKNKKTTENTKKLIGMSSKYRNMNDNNKILLKDALEKINLPDLPMYIYFSIDKKRNSQVISVKIPKNKSRKFSSKYLPLHEKINLAIEYKNLTLTVIGS